MASVGDRMHTLPHLSVFPFMSVCLSVCLSICLGRLSYRMGVSQWEYQGWRAGE